MHIMLVRVGIIATLALLGYVLGSTATIAWYG
jgi:hypothetical protein